MTTLRYGYLGPAGTFCQMALDAWTPAAGAEHVPCDSVVGALEALRAGRLDAAMVPIENSVEGGVSATLDALSVGSDVVITGEVLVPVTFVLAARPGTRLEDIRAVGTHPHGWAQVRTWMNANLPSAVYLTTLSTAAAAADLDLAAGDVAAYQAAVCAPGAATIHGLEVLAEDIGDNGRAVTRFALVARPGHTPPPTGADKTTLVLYQRDDHPGGLLELLEQFAARGRQHDPPRVAADRRGDGLVLLLDRHRGSRRGRAGGRDADGAPAGMRAGALPRLVRPRGRPPHDADGGHQRRGVRRRPAMARGSARLNQPRTC